MSENFVLTESDAPAGMLTIGRARQTVITNWQRPQKKP
jgi:bifunctional N-acetylglucosamine-1-phosphate-uridyltransferase/glucosamine-1-phosphate-acetyltransferase GlmU-like protein